ARRVVSSAGRFSREVQVFQDTWAWDGSGTARNSDSVAWLRMDLILPVKVGDAIETRSFDRGYRGAWFRGKLTDMRIRDGHLECQVEYIDYPDEKRRWNRLYKVPPKCRNQKAGQNREIMLRPPFPQWCWENDIPEHWPQMDVVAVVSSPWKVGDLIDWWYKDCFWTGKIIELLGEDKVKVRIYIGECKWHQLAPFMKSNT
uniref:Agenet domain-containing protein n=2 Tax=Aegilops tauschii subsp. strangulata TaxID=200361 RepID=A0A453GJ76_AEGTS